LAVASSRKQRIEQAVKKIGAKMPDQLPIPSELQKKIQEKAKKSIFVE